MAIDKTPYADQPLDASGSGQQRMVSSDARRNQGQVAAYLGPSGTPIAWAGGEDAPCVRIIEDVPGIVAVSLIPVIADPGVLIAATIPASLHEFWANDSRTDPTDARWVQVFDRTTAPTAGMQPAYAAWLLCAQLSVDFIEAPLGFSTGIVIAISSTPNIYTAIAAADDFAITARVLGES